MLFQQVPHEELVIWFYHTSGSSLFFSWLMLGCVCVCWAPSRKVTLNKAKGWSVLWISSGLSTYLFFPRWNCSLSVHVMTALCRWESKFFFFVKHWVIALCFKWEQAEQKASKPVVNALPGHPMPLTVPFWFSSCLLPFWKQCPSDLHETSAAAAAAAAQWLCRYREEPHHREMS